MSTDVAARGLDIKGITVVVNFDPADSTQDYVHRIGHTGRSGCLGRTYTLLVRTAEEIAKAKAEEQAKKVAAEAAAAKVKAEEQAKKVAAEAAAAKVKAEERARKISEEAAALNAIKAWIPADRVSSIAARHLLIKHFRIP